MGVSIGMINKDQKGLRGLGKILQKSEGEILEWHLPYHLCDFIPWNIYVVQQDTLCGLKWVSFNQHLSSALHVSDLIGPSSGAFVEAVFADSGMW